MKIRHLINLTVCLAVLAAPAAALAGRHRAKGVTAENKQGRPGQVLKQYDTNRNHKIDGGERDALRKAFASNTALKALDTNGDGQLDNREIDSIKAKKHATKGSAKADKRKKNKIF
jgi:hypothetical protein